MFLKCFFLPETQVGNTEMDQANCVAFDVNGDILTAGSMTYARTGQIGVWKLKEGKYSRVSLKTALPMSISGMAVSPCGQFLIAICGDLQAFVLDMHTWRERKCIHDIDDTDCFSGTFSESGKYLLLCVGNGVQMFRVPDMTLMYNVKYNEGTKRHIYDSAGNILAESYRQRRNVVFSPTGEEWAITLTKGVEIRRSTTEELIRFIEHPAPQTILYQGDTVKIWGSLPEKRYTEAYQVSSPRGFTVIYSNGFDQLVNIVHTESGTIIGQITTKYYLKDLAIDRYGRYLAAVTSGSQPPATLVVHDLYKLPVVMLDSIVCCMRLCDNRLCDYRLSDPRIFTKIREYTVPRAGSKYQIVSMSLQTSVPVSLEVPSLMRYL